MTVIDRTIESTFIKLVDQYPVVTITGPRQSGKTTLCKKVFPNWQYVNLENIDTRQFAIDDPRGFLKEYKSRVILDEIQRVPELLSYIQGIVDEAGNNGLFVLTGSQQFEISQTISQSLAGRSALLRLLPFSLEEIQAYGDHLNIDQLLLTGFYPRIWQQQLNPTQVLGDYFETYVERDLRQLANLKDLSLFQRFVRLCAGRCGQLLNLNSLASDTGISHTTARAWISLLEASYIIFLLQPYHANISKRLVKSPKLYFYDVGLACYLLGMENVRHVSRDPLRGNIFENLVITEALKHRLHHGRRSNMHFFRDSSEKEIDLLLSYGPDLFPIEIKSAMTISRSFLKGLQSFAKLFDLPLGCGLIYGGDQVQKRSDVDIRPVSQFPDFLYELDLKTGK